MSVTITSRTFSDSDVVIVDVVGKLSFLDVTLGERVNRWLEEGRRAFVLNLANVTYVDSFGLGQLISILTSIRSNGGQLILLRLTDHVLALFQITKLNTVFDISTDEAHAVISARTKAAALVS